MKDRFVTVECPYCDVVRRCGIPLDMFGKLKPIVVECSIDEDFAGCEQNFVVYAKVNIDVTTRKIETEEGGK